MPKFVKDIDRGWKAIKKRWNRTSKGISAVVGVMPPEASEDRDGISMAGIAAVHEFGSSRRNIPERSFLRTTFDENQSKYRVAMRDIEKGIVTGREKAPTALLKVAESCRSDVQDKMRRGEIKPPLKQATVEQRPKKDPTPLVDTGALLGAITARIRK